MVECKASDLLAWVRFPHSAPIKNNLRTDRYRRLFFCIYNVLFIGRRIFLILEFKIIQELKLNTEIIEIIKNYTYKTQNGKVKHLTNTNLQFINLLNTELHILRKL